MQQLVDDGGLRLAGCVPQPPDPTLVVYVIDQSCTRILPDPVLHVPAVHRLKSNVPLLHQRVKLLYSYTQ